MVLKLTVSDFKNSELKKRAYVARFLSSVAVKPPTSGGGYKATPQSCLHTDGI